jgi:ABC-type transport system substrate-binding protein
VAWAGAGVAAQVPPSSGKKPPIEEEDPVKKPLKKPPPEEDLELARNGSSLTGLAAEAERATHPELKEFFRGLASPHDRLVFKNLGPRNVMPVPFFLGPGSTFNGKIVVKAYDATWKPNVGFTVSRAEIEEVKYFEQIAVENVAQLLKLTRVGEDSTRPLGRLPRLEAAEKALAFVLAFHNPTSERRPRQGTGWKDMEARLRDQLLAVRIEQLQIAADQRNWNRAYRLADRLAEVYPDAKVQRDIVYHLARLVEEPLKEEKYEEVQQRLKLLEKIPGGAAAAEPFAAKLTSRANHLFANAQAAQEKRDFQRAGELATQAERIWPRLDGLRQLRWQLSKDRPTLGVGVSELPEFFSPATAVLDSEKQAVELLFEGLIKPRFEPSLDQLFEPALALARPRLTPQGRHFHLDSEAFWSNGERVTEADVRVTVQLLAKPGWPGYSPEWAKLVEVPAPSRDAFQVNLSLRQGFFDPSSLLAFKILPRSAHLERPDDTRFAQNPVGSGPFQLVDDKRRRDELKAGAVVFTANGAYRRTYKPNMPYIQEIRFYKCQDPVVDFNEGRLQLLLDWPTRRLKEFQGMDRVTIQTLPNRRIYFLAVNHRENKALQDVGVRKAIAHAINRNQILNDVFREPEPPAGTALPHRPLNGPYPAGSWACEPSLPSDPFKPQLARSLAAEKKSQWPDIKLTLKYPAANAPVEEACKKIQDQVRETAGIDLVLEPRTPRQLYEDVELNHDYELAYYHFDYPSEAFWLWPLFNPDPQSLARGGRNYLGYHNDGQLASDFQHALAHCDPVEVTKYTHRIHKQIFEKMPLIPLWQLDTHVVSDKELTAVHLDPLLVFTEVEKWKLEKR